MNKRLAVLAVSAALVSAPLAASTYGQVAMPTTSATSCAGDCNDDGQVTVNELIELVDIDLGEALVPSNGCFCPACSVLATPEVARCIEVFISCTVLAIGNALSGTCPH